MMSSSVASRQFGIRARTCAAVLFFAAAGTAGAQTFQNGQYRMTIGADGTAEVSFGTQPPVKFAPVFEIISCQKDPKVMLRPAGIKSVSYNVATWQTGQKAASDGSLGKVDTNVTAGDGFDPTILKGDQQGRTPNYFQAGELTTLRASGARPAERGVVWTFPENPLGELSATLTLPEKGEPRLAFTFKAKRAGWYSVGYAGAPAYDVAKAQEIWQPLIWAEKRFPDRPYLTAAFHCPVPAPMVNAEGQTVSLVVEPAELPFEPLPTFANSRFGVMIRNAQGQAQPRVFAPILGGEGSKMAAGESRAFGVRLFVRPISCNDALRCVAREMYGFRDERTNTLCSLNRTLENMIDYGMSEYSRFNQELRGCAYDTDAPGTVKNVSSLHPLAAALVTDNAEIYRLRARPIIEFVLSRQKFLFATSPEIKVQSPGWKLLGPCAPLSELAALYEISQRQTPLFLELATDQVGKTRTLNLDETTKGDTWQNNLALYNATGDKSYLTRATQQADAYLAERLGQPQTNFAKGMFFWSAFAPDWQALLELYDATREPRYLAAAHEGARRACEYIWFCPLVPDGDVTVNRGGVAPEYWYLKKRGAGPIKIAQESVPAWRVSEIGLTSESSGTSSGHRAILPACYAPAMLRLAELTNDAFLHDVARWAVVGRYANFPGYHINTGRTTVYEKADYPLRPFKELTYNSFHFNHIWPHIAMVIDYLVSDVCARSDGAIDFPSHFAEGYAYLKCRIYGDRPGRFYDARDVWLWMPKGLVAIDNVQINYIAARGGERTLYLALTNQSPAEVNAAVTLDAKLVGFGPELKARLWRDNKPAGEVTVKAGKVTVPVSGGGITALAIDGVKIAPQLQADFSQSPRPLSDKSRATLAYGGTHAMLISMAKFTHAYVYLQATFEEFKSATLHYRAGGEWKTITDNAYPYEFTVELGPQDERFEFWVEGVGVDGKVSRSETATLER